MSLKSFTGNDQLLGASVSEAAAVDPSAPATCADLEASTPVPAQNEPQTETAIADRRLGRFGKNAMARNMDATVADASTATQAVGGKLQAPAPNLSASRNLSTSAASLVKRFYEPIATPLAQVETRLMTELQSPYESIGHLLRHGTQLGGKRMRPALVLLAGQCVGEIAEDHITLGIIIEMVHTATLIHDDVLDEAETRRHSPTINARWSNHTSILLGDYMFAQGFRLAASMGNPRACVMIGEAVRLVCEGEMRQVLQRDALDIDEATYLDILRGKTAELCRVACELGAIASAGGDDEIQALGRYGNALGIAFQIADDYLDLWGDDQAVGKTLGTDIEQGKMTLPLIRLLETSSPNVARQVTEILRGPAPRRLDRVRPLLADSDAKHYTKAMAQKFRLAAIEALGGLAPSVAKESLLSLADFAIDRNF